MLVERRWDIFGHYYGLLWKGSQHILSASLCFVPDVSNGLLYNLFICQVTLEWCPVVFEQFTRGETNAAGNCRYARSIVREERARSRSSDMCMYHTYISIYNRGPFPGSWARKLQIPEKDLSAKS